MIQSILILMRHFMLESRKQKVFYVMLGITIIGLAFCTYFFSNSGLPTDIPKMKNSPFKSQEEMKIFLIFYAPMSAIFGINVLLSIFTSLSFFNDFYKKGSIEIFLGKPISRGEYLIGSYLGGLSMMFFIVTLLTFGIFFLSGFILHIWNVLILVPILTFTFMFAIVYSIILFLTITFQSPIIGMLTSFLYYAAVSPLLMNYDKLDYITQNEYIKGTVKALYYILPKTEEISKQVTVSLMAGTGEVYYQQWLTSIAFLILILFGSIKVYDKKDI